MTNVTKEYSKATTFSEEIGERLAKKMAKETNDLGWCWEDSSGVVCLYNDVDKIIGYVSYGH